MAIIGRDFGRVKFLIDKLESERILSLSEFVELISCHSEQAAEYLFSKSDKIRRKYYGNEVYIRGLIEFTSYCRNNCLYCGLRSGNLKAQRYRLTPGEILSCCEVGYDLGFRTFVLQGGEDNHYSDSLICEIVSGIKSRYPDCAVTLSIGERSRESYKAYFDAGADRYLLRHETADEAHYNKLHPSDLSLSNRKRCLFNLKEIGYQVGSGFMVGSPFQTAENLAQDMLFLHELQPHMVGIGPFIPHCDTPFKAEPPGSVELTLFMIGLIRLMLPHSLIPATTALGTLSEDGRTRGIKAGANVVMPNLSPADVREKYLLYNNKLSIGMESAQNKAALEKQMLDIGYKVAISRGDCITS